jgi:DNA-binding MarR family transcriptional regulator
MSHKELELLVVDFNRTRDIVTDVNERYLIYEALRRDIKNLEPYNLKWIESTLKLSFPKVKNIIDNLIENGYLVKKKSKQDKRITWLVPTRKLYQGTLLFEQMKMNELHKQNMKIKNFPGKPCLSDFSNKSKEKLKEIHLNEFISI